MRIWPRFLLLLLSCLTAAGCGGIGADIRQLERSFTSQGFVTSQQTYGRFLLRESVRAGQIGTPVWIIYAGDGRAWLDPWTPSADPTPAPGNMPSIPIAHEIATQFPTDTVVHLTRPCQFLTSADHECTPHYWTRNRFGKNVRRAYAQHAGRFSGQPIIFVGWSGGGVIAAHMAQGHIGQNRQIGLLTMASPLDLDRWTQWHSVFALPDEDNPASFLPLPIPTIHAVGDKDRVVPPQTVSHLAGHDTIKGIDHHGSWQNIARTAAATLRRDLIAAQP